MTLQEILSQMGSGGISAVILIALTLIEVTPIKINPWSALLKWIGRKTNAELYSKVDALQIEVEIVKKDFEEKNAHDKRWSILDFANSCHNGRRHTKEEWEHVLNQLIYYEEYVDEKAITNAVIEEETRYLRELYRDLLSRNAFMREGD